MVFSAATRPWAERQWSATKKQIHRIKLWSLDRSYEDIVGVVNDIIDVIVNQAENFEVVVVHS